MPGLNGTGPRGDGPFTGRGEGSCIIRIPDREGAPILGFAGRQGRPIRIDTTRTPLSDRRPVTHCPAPPVVWWHPGPAARRGRRARGRPFARR